MDKEWQKSKEEWYQSEITKRKDVIIKGIDSSRLITEDKKKELIDKLNKGIEQPEPYGLYGFCLDLSYGFFLFCGDNYNKGDYESWQQWIEEIDLEKFRSMVEYKSYYDGSRYLDSEPMEFDGDIIITDPCYIMRERDESDRPKWSDFHPYKSICDYPDYDERTKTSKMFSENSERYHKADDEWREAHPDDWDVCECGSKMEALGIHNYMTRDTLYGDWSCTTYNTDTKEAIGEFCADAGLVSVFSLKEVLKYNPDFDYHTDRTWTTTWIKDFKGTVQFVVVYTDGYYEDETEYHKKGEHWEDYSVEVVGHGINKVTGEPINFVGKQTGF